MKINAIDHIVITTGNLNKCLDFYVGLLGMKHEMDGTQHTLIFGKQKINIHTYKGEFQPAAKNPEYGAQDFCLTATGNPEEIKREFINAGVSIVEGVVEMKGARGKMKSVYVYDPDGNLIEVAVYEK